MPSKRTPEMFVLWFGSFLSENNIFLRELSQAFARHGKKTLLIDLNPSMRLAEFFGMEEKCEDFASETINYDLTLMDLIIQKSKGAKGTSLRNVVRVPFPNVSLLPADERLIDWEFSCSEEERRDKFLRLKKIIQGVSKFYDVTMINCPPDKLDLSLFSLALVEGVAVFLPIGDHTINHLNSFIRWLKKTNGRDKILQFREKKFLLVPTRFDNKNQRHEKVLMGLQKNHGKFLSEVIFPAEEKVEKLFSCFEKLSLELGTF